MNSKKKKITDSKFKFTPMAPFKTYEEEANFWDTHDTTEFWDKSSVKWTGKTLVAAIDPQKVKDHFKKDDSVTFRLPGAWRNRLEQTANNIGLSVSSLTRMWIIEKLTTAK